jgi:hypothetical protein
MDGQTGNIQFVPLSRASTILWPSRIPATITNKAGEVMTMTCWPAKISAKENQQPTQGDPHEEEIERKAGAQQRDTS